MNLLDSCNWWLPHNRYQTIRASGNYTLGAGKPLLVSYKALVLLTAVSRRSRHQPEPYITLCCHRSGERMHKPTVLLLLQMTSGNHFPAVLIRVLQW